MARQLALGIDLGTTNSCVGVYKVDDEVEIIDNQQGERITPSQVAFSTDEIFIGTPAKEAGEFYPKNTIYHSKRFIGCNFNDKSVQNDIKHWPFCVKNVEGKPMVEVTFNSDKKLHPAEYISGQILKKLSQDANEKLHKSIVNAVITVPAYFEHDQREATKTAAEIAGLKVLALVKEPVAGALAYGHYHKIRDKQNLLIFDLGGGTFDATIITYEDNSYNVKSYTGDTHLGGSDFDMELVKYFVQQFNYEYGAAMTLQHKSIPRLLGASEKVKCRLSSALHTNIIVAQLQDGKALEMKITRDKFEELIKDRCEKCFTLTDQLLRNADFTTDDIDKVVLVGGSTRIPLIQRRLGIMFGKEKIDKTVTGDESVAFGAALRAAMLNGMRVKSKIQDITPLSFGVRIIGGMFSVVIPRHSQIPISKTKNYTTVEDNQTEILCEIYEGERALVQDNHKIGGFTLTGIKPANRGNATVEVTFSIDDDCTLTVTTKDKDTGNKNNVTIKHNDYRMTKNEVMQLVEEMKRFELKDKERWKVHRAKEKLRDLAYKIKHGNYSNNQISSCNDCIKWLDEASNITIENVVQKGKDLDRNFTI